MKFDQDLCETCDMNSTLGSVVPLAMFTTCSVLSEEKYSANIFLANKSVVKELGEK